MRALIAAAALGALSGCGADELAPEITALRYIDQVPQRPLILRFEVAFRDPDGDLGPGALHLLLDGEERSQLAVTELFAAQTPELPKDSKEGRFRVQVELDPPVEDGREVEVGMWVEDRRGARSNEPSITLKAAALDAGGDT